MEINELKSKSKTSAVSLRKKVAEFMQQYFSQLHGEKPCNIHEFFLDEVEEPLLIKVMQYVKDNQSEAARVLGISRGTLRSKLKKFGMLEKGK